MLNNNMDELIEDYINTRRIFFNLFDKFNKEKKATLLQFESLKFIKDKKEASMGEIAENLHISMSSATQLVERMIKSNYIKRIHKEDDRRIIKIATTKLGEEELERIGEQIREKLTRLLSKIPPKDLEEYLRIQKEILNLFSNKNAFNNK